MPFFIVFLSCCNYYYYYYFYFRYLICLEFILFHGGGFESSFIFFQMAAQLFQHHSFTKTNICLRDLRNNIPFIFDSVFISFPKCMHCIYLFVCLYAHTHIIHCIILSGMITVVATFFGMAPNEPTFWY